ncbi:hypothetical protein SAMN05421736_1304 [Evansella caseinilytica]|uniref:Phosphoesterase n=1 Tax=Evansella caseinilytica TaxID=1503961 RepID=A0A1H3UYG8_9BACI|nr:metallophosphoesterase [Evansella caseinilytica]SDZ67490.1 hypothetical protein SAMN05421736_1304 [Evansella caseinilytica]
MKALIMSDSHGWDKEVAEVVHRHQQEVDVIFHCGDSELSIANPLFKQVLSVSGNCDFGEDFPAEIIKKINGVTFYISHGHLLNVKMNAMNLLYKGEEHGADIVCFGHTHVPVAFQEKNIVFINPGSMRLPRQHTAGTYVLLKVEDDQVDVTYYSLVGEEQKQLTKTFLKNH